MYMYIQFPEFEMFNACDTFHFFYSSLLILFLNFIHKLLNVFLHKLNFFISPCEPTLEFHDPLYQHLAVGLHLLCNDRVLLNRFGNSWVLVHMAVGGLQSWVVLRHAHSVQWVAGAGPWSHASGILGRFPICFKIFQSFLGLLQLPC